MRLKHYAQTPNKVITDKDLTPNGKRVFMGLLFAARKDGTVKNATIRALACVCHCDKGTVQVHLQELERKGYISKLRRYRYSLSLGRPVFDNNEYRLHLPTEGGYTLIPSSILQKGVTGACFAVMLYLYLCAGREGRAHPSIRHIAGTRKDCDSGCGVSKASICRALKVLARMKFFIKLFCQTVRGCLSCNSYLLTEMVKKEAATFEVAASCTVDPVCCSSFWGSLKIRTHLWINKITGDDTLRKKEIGIPKFGRLYKLLDRISAFCTPLFSRFLRPPVKDSS